MQGPGQPPQQGQAAPFDPDQFKQDILNAVQQELSNFAQHMQPPQQMVPPGQPVYGLPPAYGQPPMYAQSGYNQPMYGQVVPSFPPMQGSTGQYAQQSPQQFFPQQPGQQFGLMPVQPQPMMPYGQQPTMEQLMQAMLLLFQRQEQLIQELQNMRTNPGQLQNNHVVSAPIVAYPYMSHHVDQYKWLVDYGLQYNMDGTPRQVVTQQDIKNRRQQLDALEMRLSFSEYWQLVGEHYHGVIFPKY